MRALDEVLYDTIRARVTEDDTVLLEVADPAALGALREALAVSEPFGGHCMCQGDLTFEFFDGDGQRTAVVGFHHAASLRWSGWDGDALLRDGQRVLRWLEDHGLAGPPQAGVEIRERWLAAAPPAVRALLDLPVSTGVLPKPVQDLITRRLTEAVPDPVERAAALLSWYGSGSGRCSGHPVHEDLPAPALAATPIEVLIAALRKSPVDAGTDAGAVRHLCGSQTRAHQAEDIARLPDDVRDRLLASAQAAGDDDKRLRAQRWLGEKRQPRHRSS